MTEALLGIAIIVTIAATGAAVLISRDIKKRKYSRKFYVKKRK